MGKINVLSFAVANLIAAGEVVDRPASVVKELMENAIDAGARHITVEIRNGGTTFMRVADDGCGMTAEDLPIAVKRHATSKISTEKDLEGITTLGFRGEALAAIAAVSELRIITRTKEAQMGAMLVSSAGEIKEITEQGAPKGTTVIVENLFFNVPARRKFLKKDVSESIAVSAYVEKIALSHPEIAVRLIVDGNMRLETAGDGNPKNAVYAVFGREFAAKLIAVSGGDGGVRVEGFIGRPDSARPKRNYENFFINGRYITSKTASAALEQAYTSFIAPEKFPCCVLYITIDPAAVDVNVHPAKLEVKFSNERPVFEAVYYAVRAALEENTDRPELKIPAPRPDAAHAFAPIEEGKRESLDKRQVPMFGERTAPAFSRMSAAEYQNRFAQNRLANAFGKSSGEKNAEIPISAALGETFGKREEETEQKDAPRALPAVADAVKEAERVSEQKPDERAILFPRAEWRVIGEAFRMYILAEVGDTLLLIDKHAAHERVIFEDLLRNLRASERPTQSLLLPLTLSASREDCETLHAFEKEVGAVGFSFAVSENEIAVSEIPDGLTAREAGELLLTIAAQLRDGEGKATISRDILFEKALYQGACKAAMKGGREYPPEYVAWLCRRLAELEDITVCPHGRPIAVKLTRAMLDRQFGRT